jgi:hypothetical protein
MSQPLPLQSRLPNLKSRTHGGRSSMVEPQVVVLVVAGSSPVGHPSLRGGGGITDAKSPPMNSTTDLFGQSEFRIAPANFWERIVNDEQLSGHDDLEKLLVGCEIIAALDAAELLAA